MFVSSKGMNVMCEIAKKLRAENDSLKKELAETELSLMLAESELEAKKTKIAQLENELRQFMSYADEQAAKLHQLEEELDQRRNDEADVLGELFGALQENKLASRTLGIEEKLPDGLYEVRRLKQFHEFTAEQVND